MGAQKNRIIEHVLLSTKTIVKLMIDKRKFYSQHFVYRRHDFTFSSHEISEFNHEDCIVLDIGFVLDNSADLSTIFHLGIHCLPK